MPSMDPSRTLSESLVKDTAGQQGRHLAKLFKLLALFCGVCFAVYFAAVCSRQEISSISELMQLGKTKALRAWGPRAAARHPMQLPQARHGTQRGRAWQPKKSMTSEKIIQARIGQPGKPPMRAAATLVLQEPETRAASVSSSSPSTPARQGHSNIIVVRHGQTPWNVEGRVQGQTDIELNEAGWVQAGALAQVLQTQGIADQVDAIVPSDLKRAYQTARMLKTVCPRAQLYIDPDFREINFGNMQGKVFKEEKDLFFNVTDEWKSGNLHKSFPGENGDSWADLMHRGLAAFRRAATLGSTVLVVSHCNFLRWCAAGVELGPEPAAESMYEPRIQALITDEIPNGCRSTLVYDHETGSLRAEKWFEPLSNPIPFGDEKPVQVVNASTLDANKWTSEVHKESLR
eukprot:gnl/TRDRNA2_/TRDRNA2_131363_c0_seq1.p1 gnl/TRDRNA2_/TRDRNA2_131363_c0~~gnl/TRDRNA2_/TRDRNA2_131363_c0_seq1.p1  ORF type:complete len:403 (-),score=68.87 gnl/TRDRNA2_/TRDRNA2_131363_c0_seq1:110-1318(-)